MKMELDKTGLVDLVCGTDPEICAGEDESIMRFQKKNGNKSVWDREALRRLELPELRSLYQWIRAVEY